MKMSWVLVPAMVLICTFSAIADEAASRPAGSQLHSQVRDRLEPADRLLVAFQQSERDRSPAVGFRAKDDPALGADVRAWWDERALTLEVRVFDPTDGPGGVGAELWIHDGIQVGIETNPENDILLPGYTPTSFEMGFSPQPDGGVAMFCWQPGGLAMDDVRAESEKLEAGYRLTAAIPWKMLGAAAPLRWLGLNILVNDGSNGRRFTEWTRGIGDGKDPNEYVRVALVGRDAGQSSAGRFATDQMVGKAYDEDETFSGRFVEYALADLPAQEVTLTATHENGQAIDLGTADLPPAAAGQVRVIQFTAAASRLAAEGRYRLSASDRPVTAVKPIVRTNTKRRIEAKIQELSDRTDALEKRLAERPEHAADAYVGMGVPTARRFLDHVRAGGWEGNQSDDWDVMQLEEVEWILDWTDERLDRLSRGEVQVYQRPVLRPETVTVRDGAFHGKIIGDDRERPLYLGGYGAWDKVITDLPFLTAVATNLTQQSAWSKMMQKDGSIEFLGIPSETGPSRLLKNLDTCAERGVMVDPIMTLHVLPDWVAYEADDVYGIEGGGFIRYKIDHPVIRRVLRMWTEALVAPIKDKPALLSVCTTNEPAYAQSGRDKYSRPAWIAYLRERHETIESLNALYQTEYATFEDVPVPPLLKSISELPKELTALRWYYDWMAFNNRHHAAFHRWLHDEIKAVGPNVRAHTKIMPLLFDRANLFMGIDPELMTEPMDLAGCDSFGRWSWTPGGEYAYDWQEEEAWYELLFSFGGKPVYNSENHLLNTDLPPIHIPVGHTRCEVWQNALHHLTASAIWVWEVFPPYEGATIYRRPANIYAAGKAAFDANRLANEVAAINADRPEAAILYSMNSIFWQDDCPALMPKIFTALMFMGKPATFISERQLAAGVVPANLKWIVLPHATHLTDEAVAGLARFVESGGRVVNVGSECMAWDAYHRPRSLPQVLAQAPTVDLPATEKQLHAALREIFSRGGMEFLALLDAETGQPVWGVEYRAVAYRNRLLVPMVNFLNRPQRVRVHFKGQAMDLLAERSLDLDAGEGIALESLQPRVLSIGD
ncbi:MAG: hypothetical protein GXY33_21075 [Phycisphaerae bacterium]|nr:hypothetical protein [Phycisphaerae bacterium]